MRMCGDEPMCAWIDPPSIQAGEYLPFRWDLEVDSSLLTNSCSDASAGKVDKDTLMCHFVLYNGSERTTQNNQ